MKQKEISRIIEEAEQRIGHVFNDRNLLLDALTHTSFHHEHRSSGHNERLEFLGDAVVGLLVVEHLFRMHPSHEESVLARIKSHVVSEPVLAQMARELALGDLVRLGRGEAATGGTEKPSILADCFEAVVGALYLDAGFDATREKIMGRFSRKIGRIIEKGDFFDYKTELQELTQQRFGLLPQYHVLKETGEDHQRVFTVAVFLGGRELAAGSGGRKKEAESKAARKAIAFLVDETSGS